MTVSGGSVTVSPSATAVFGMPVAILADGQLEVSVFCSVVCHPPV